MTFASMCLISNQNGSRDRSVPECAIPLSAQTTTTSTMDVDRVDEPGPSTSNPNVAQKRLTVPVDDAHPFDLESYISNYSGAYPLLIETTVQ